MNNWIFWLFILGAVFSPLDLLSGKHPESHPRMEDSDHLDQRFTQPGVG